MREIVMDTETTGLDAKNGDRLIEIGCVEIINRIPTGNEYHAFINPDGRDVPPDAVAIHGITTEFLKDKPLFKDVVRDFFEFIGDAPLVIHNASFDIGFINAELKRIRMAPMEMDRVIDTLALARRKHPAGPHNLDALCRRYNIDNSKRDKHGAIIDSLLLADVYVELLGERQAALGLIVNGEESQNSAVSHAPNNRAAKLRPTPLPNRLSEADIERHTDFINTLGENALWKLRMPPST